MTETILPSASGRPPQPANHRQPQLGQVFTAEGPLDLSAIYVMHHGFRRDLSDFERAIPATPLNDEAAWTALGRRWLRLADALQHHERVEDHWMWPPALARLTEPGDTRGRVVLQSMAREHVRVDEVMVLAANAFRDLLAAPEPPRHDRLVAAVDLARTVLLAHLAHEEAEAMPLIQAGLTPGAWRSSQRSAAKEYGLRDLGFTVPWSARGIPEDQFALAFAHGGFAVRLLLALTRRRFTTEHERAFRHLARD